MARELGRHGLEGINPAEAQLPELVEADRSGPLQLVNLLAFRTHAAYPPGHRLATAGLSGADAYGRYGAVAFDQVRRRAGRLTLLNHVEQVLIGSDRAWDQVAVMEYPDTRAFLDMIADPVYVAALDHRDAGLATTMVLVTRPLLPPG